MKPPIGNESENKFVFRYPIRTNSGERQSPPDAVVRVIQDILDSLLGLIVPCHNGEEVKIDGFKLLRNREVLYPLFIDWVKGGVDQSDNATSSESLPSKAVKLYEPRIEFLQKALESILTVIDLEHEGRPAQIDAFRLKNLNQWRVASTGDPSEVFEHAASRCNCDCIFCYNKGTPEEVALSNYKHYRYSLEEETGELDTRVDYFNPQAKSGLFLTLGSSCEAMIHPYFWDVLQKLRLKTNHPFRINTNGTRLKRDVVANLAEIKPVYLDISLNSSVPSRRKELMKDLRPEVAINALPLLKDYTIPYSVIIVPWPLGSLEKTLIDLERTVAYASSHEAHMVQVSLPGYSKYFSSVPLFDRDEVWTAVVSKVRQLRPLYPECPIVVMPSMYEENLFEPRKNLAQVIGVARNSPAALAGLKQGDVIQKVEEIPIKNRPQAREFLSALGRYGMELVRISIKRGATEFDLAVNPSSYRYPFDKSTSRHFGIVFLGTGFRAGYVETLRDVIKAHKTNNVLLLSSQLVRPVLEEVLAQSGLLADKNLRLEIEVPENRFFGGNIILGDLLVVQDFIDHLLDRAAKGRGQPDLIIIPSSPFGLGEWGRDLTGRVYLDIERAVGSPVVILPCQTIYD